MTKADRISIVMACDEGYAMPLATALRSIVDSNRHHWPLDVYIITNGFPEPARDKIRQSLPEGSAALHWVALSLERFTHFSTMSHVSRMTFARLLLTDLLPASLSRVLYLDADLLVLSDLEPLWTMPLLGKAAGAVRDVIDPFLKENHPSAAGLPLVKNYFNAGVLLIDLAAWRERCIGEKAIEFLVLHPKTPFADQDALNFALDGIWTELSDRWNFQGHRKMRIAEMADPPVIAHFVTREKPWKREFHTPNEGLFDRYRSQTQFSRSSSDKLTDAWKTTRFRCRKFAKLVIGGRPVYGGHAIRSATAASGESTKIEVLRSTTIVGGASAITLIFRIVRTKVLAVLLGPAGIGIESLFDSVLSVMRSVFDMGTSNSGVRQIAAAVSARDPRQIATTVFTLRRTCAILGILAAATLFLVREPASRIAFGDATHATSFGWLSIALFAGIMIGGQAALLQGVRRLGDLARMNIIGAGIGAVTSIPIVVIWGQAGIPAYMIVTPVVGLLVAWYYARQVAIQPVQISAAGIAKEARSLISLGFAVMLTTLIVVGGTFLVRTLVVREYGLHGAGQFQAASALSMVYVGFILQSMGTDFYPRLTAVAGDHERFNLMVKEQASVSLVVALPGVLGTIALAPWVVQIFYSSGFSIAAEILVWQMGGVLLKVMSWPMGFMNFAKGKGRVIVGIDLVANAAYVALALALLKPFGIAGAGLAYLGMNAVHLLITYAMVRRLSGFRWGGDYLRRAGVCLAVALAVMWMRMQWPEPWATLVPCLIAAAAAIYSMRNILQIIGIDRARLALARLRLGWLLNYF